MSTLGLRIKMARALRNMSQARLAEACGWESGSRIGNYEQETREPSLADIKTIAEALWVAESWLLSGSTQPTDGGNHLIIDGILTIRKYPSGHAKSNELCPWTAATQPLSIGEPPPKFSRELREINEWETADDLADDEYVMIPKLALKLSAGNGKSAVDLDTQPPLAFRTAWIRQRRLKSKELACMEASGDSMEPSIQDGDSLLIDLGDRDVRDGSVYALRYGDELRVKRVYKRFDGGLTIRSDNSGKFPEQTITLQDMEHVAILGRVIWRAGGI